MQIVIDIPEDMYYAIEHRYWSVVNETMLLSCVANGTPLPKGHGDLIDKGIFKKWIETQDGDTIMPEYYLDALDEQETIIEAERSDEE